MRWFLGTVANLFLLTSCAENDQGHYLKEDHLVLVSESTSPNKKFKIVEYQFDNGGFGYSRVFWAIVPSSNGSPDLQNYVLPDGYKAKGWNANNHVLIEKWEPYYYKKQVINLKTGDIYLGVVVRIINE